MKIIRAFLLIVLTSLMWACGEESLDPNSIFAKADPDLIQNDFDKWLSANYTAPYNVNFNYRYDDKETDNKYNLAPADYDKSIALAKLMKHVWMDAYTEVKGQEFIKMYCPRVMQLIGSPAYNSQGELVLGTAEGGMKITLYNVNIIDVDNPFIDSDNPFGDNPKDLNFWFFKTMHHEFGHILQQKKNYPTAFNLISSADYKAGDWVNLDDVNAPMIGFVSGYASMEANEDFVEILSLYVTHTEDAWQELLEAGVQRDDANNILDDSGKQKILAKFDYVKTYLKDSWQIDIDKLREVVLRRSKEAVDLDLRTFN